MRQRVISTVMKSLPVVSSLAVGIGVTLAILHRDTIENKAYDKLLYRQLTKENIPLQ